MLVVVEYLRSHLFSLLLYAKESLLGPHWTFATLGYGLNPYYTAVLAFVGGVYILSFIIALINLIFYYLFKQKKWFYLSLFFIILIIPVSFHNLNPDFHSVEIVQTAEKDDYLDLFSYSDADIVVFPENSIGKQFYVDKSSINILTNQLGIFSTTTYNVDGTITNRLFYQKGNNILESYDKTFLMPFGEYSPWFLKDPVKKLNKGHELKSVNFNDHIIGGTICGSFITPVIVRKMVRKNDAEVIINVASSSSFASDQYRKINLDYAKIRAIESGRYFIQSSNMGYSFVIDNKGNVVDALTNSDKARFISNFEYKFKKTPYVVHGDWIVWLSLIIIFVFLIMLYKDDILKNLKKLRVK